MLQAMFQLFNTSLTLILRPIGDFIGFLLRPIMIYFLQNVAVPFYRYFTPFMQKYGTTIGEGMLTILKFIASGGLPGFVTSTVGPPVKKLTIDATIAAKNFLDQIGTAITKALNPQSLTDDWNKIVAVFQGIDQGISPILKFWDNISGFFQSLSNGTDPLKTIWSSVTGFFQWLSNGTDPLKTIWSSVTGFFNLLYKDLNGTVFNAWGEVEGFFNTLLKDVTTVLQPIWTVFMNFWNAIYSFVKNIVDFVKDPVGFLTNANNRVNTMNALTASTTQLQSAAGVVIHNLNITGLQLGADATMLLKDPIGYITKAIQTVNSKAVAR